MPGHVIDEQRSPGRRGPATARSNCPRPPKKHGAVGRREERPEAPVAFGRGRVWVWLLCSLFAAAVDVAAAEPPLVGEANAGPFRVLAQTSQADAERVAGLLRQQAEAIGALVPELRPPAGARFRVLLLRDRQALRRFLSRRGVHGGSTFCYVHQDDWRRRRIIGYVAPNAKLTRGLTHELVHALLRARVAQPPVWFDEGLAEWLELAARPNASSELKGASPADPSARPPINVSWVRTLQRTLATRPDALTVSSLLVLPAANFGLRRRQAYALSWGMCEALGRDRLRALLRRLGPVATEATNRARLARAVGDLAPLSVWKDRLGRLSVRQTVEETMEERAPQTQRQPVLEKGGNP